MPLTVEVVSAERVLWEGQARSLAAPAADGDIGILPGHQPVLTVLRPGEIRIGATDGEDVQMEVDGGFLSVDADQVTVVVDPSAADVTEGSDGTGAGDVGN